MDQEFVVTLGKIIENCPLQLRFWGDCAVQTVDGAVVAADWNQRTVDFFRPLIPAYAKAILNLNVCIFKHIILPFKCSLGFCPPSS